MPSYPSDAASRLADRLMNRDHGLPRDEALETATDMVIDITIAVDKLRAIEAERRRSSDGIH